MTEIKLRWDYETALPTDRLLLIQSALEPWHGTRYKLFSQTIGGGVDCIRFVCAAADTMYGMRTKVPRVYSDAAMQNPERARATMRWLMEHYNYRSIGGDSLVLPADVIVTGPRGGGPGHASFAGADGYLWQCTEGSGVHRTGLGSSGDEFHALLRRI